MRNFLIIILIALLVGCTTTTDTTPIHNDTSLTQASITPTGYQTTSNHTLTLVFEEPVILTMFKINDITQNITKVSDTTYKLSKNFNDGTYVLSIAAEDASGNQVTQTAQLIIDTVSPTVTVDPENNEQVIVSDVNITLLFSEEVEITEAKIGTTLLSFTTTDNKSFHLVKNLNNGDYTLKIEAKDPAGNTVSSETNFSVAQGVPDTSAPPQITGVDAEDTGDGGKIKITWDATPVNDFKEYRIYQSSNDITNVFGMQPHQTIIGKATVSWIISGLTDGSTYCFAVTAVDYSLNENTLVSDACDKPSESDKTPPSILSPKPQNLVDDTNRPIINITTDEAAYCRYSISNESNEDWEYDDLDHPMSRNSAKKIHHRQHAALDNGTWWVYAACEDMEENVMDGTKKWDFDIEYYEVPDEWPPDITNVENISHLESIEIKWDTNESADSTIYWGDASDNITVTKHSSTMTEAHSIEIIGLTESTPYYFIVGSCDDSNNCANSTTGSHTFKTLDPDTDDPIITIISPEITTYFDGPTLKYYVNEVADCHYTLDNGANNDTVNDNSTVLPSADGSYDLILYCIDSSDNEGSETVAYTLDSTPDNVTISFTQQSNTTINMTWGAITGAVEYEIQGNATMDSTTNTEYDTTGLEPGKTYYFQIRPVDAAGNFGTWCDPEYWDTDL